MYPWLAGENPRPDRLADPDRTARDLAGFIGALCRIDPAGGPGPEAGNAYRGVPMGDARPSLAAEARIRPKLAALDDHVDTKGLTAVWEAALAAPAWDGPPVWIHGVDEATWARGRGWGLAMTLPSPAEFADPDRAARARRVVEGFLADLSSRLR